MTRRMQTEIQKKISKPLEFATWAFVVFGLIILWWLPPTVSREAVVVMLLIIALYAIIYYHWLFPRYHNRPWLTYVPTLVNLAGVAAIDYLVGPALDIRLVYAAVVVGVAIRVGRLPGIIAAILAAGLSLIVTLYRAADLSASLISEGFDLAVFVLLGHLAGSLTATIRQQSTELVRHNKDLALLIDTNHVATTSPELEQTLAGLAEKIAKGVPATYCCVSLVQDETGELRLVGIYPLRPLMRLASPSSQILALADMPWHRRVIETGQAMIIRQDLPETAMGEAELTLSFFEGMSSACLMPILIQDRVAGIIAVGEARRWEQQPFGRQKLDLLQSIAAQAAAGINNVRLHEALEQQLDRLAVIHEVTRAITSTIEMDQLLELIYQQLSRVIPSDTYYVSLHDAGSDMIDMRVIIDEGQRFAPERVRYGEGLASYVIQEHKPLLVHHLSREMDTLPIKPKIVGKKKISESWLGVPIAVSDRFSGVLVVASYKPNAFDEEDIELLTTVSNQAAIALDNARHHATVEEQARRDSLTGVYNHGYFFQRLNEIEHARKEESPVSLIMLDIDHFKEYNDRYGHVMGDEVLRFIVQAIQAHVKPIDVVGRWGGEEFGLILPNTTTEQALGVAERIRETLLHLPLLGKDQLPIPKPTVSQGIATLPDHAADASGLIDLADQALYQAKGLGRDQVIVAARRV